MFGFHFLQLRNISAPFSIGGLQRGPAISQWLNVFINIAHHSYVRECYARFFLFVRGADKDRVCGCLVCNPPHLGNQAGLSSLWARQSQPPAQILISQKNIFTVVLETKVLGSVFIPLICRPKGYIGFIFIYVVLVYR